MRHIYDTLYCGAKFELLQWTVYCMCTLQTLCPVDADISEGILLDAQQ